jgi:NADPH:quinone reductase
MNRQFVLKSRPVALPTPDEVVFGEVPVPVPGADEVLIRNLYMSLDPAIRGWMSDEPNYIPPIPVGSPVWATAIGRIAASNSPDFEVGDTVISFNGWEDYTCAPAAMVNKLDTSIGLPLSWFLGILGPTGLTAYFGLTEVGKPQAGETLLISGAAGAVGSVVGQMGKIMGCRVVGLAGSEEKCQWLKEECGFDEVINYRSCGDMQQAIAEACPDGVDVYWDNVGGDTLDAALMNLAQNARIVFCGWISTYNDAEKQGGPKNLWQLLAKSARMEGFVVKDYVEQFPEAIAQLGGWLAEGKIKHREHVVEGLENALDAFHMLFDGRNEGKLVVRIAPEDE